MRQLCYNCGISGLAQSYTGNVSGWNMLKWRPLCKNGHCQTLPAHSNHSAKPCAWLPHAIGSRRQEPPGPHGDNKRPMFFHLPDVDMDKHLDILIYIIYMDINMDMDINITIHWYYTIARYGLPTSAMLDNTVGTVPLCSQKSQAPGLRGSCQLPFKHSRVWFTNAIMRNSLMASRFAQHQRWPMAQRRHNASQRPLQ